MNISFQTAFCFLLHRVYLIDSLGKLSYLKIQLLLYLDVLFVRIFFYFLMINFAKEEMSN